MARALLAAAALAAPCLALADLTVLSEFNVVEYTWSSPEERASAIASGTFIPSNNVITGLKACNSDVAARCGNDQRLFATVPRWLPGVPGTLNEVVERPGSSPLLAPWPSRDAQDPSDCSKIQYVQSMEIDPEGVMWVVDVGRKYFNDEAAADNSCPPKMVLLDVISAEVLETYVFPSEVAPYSGAFLNDIVLDVYRQVAYISSTGNNVTDLGAVVVYDRKARSSRRFEHASSTHAEEDTFMIHGLPNSGVPTDGIALHPKRDRLFYSALSGYHLHSVSTAALRDFSLPNSAVVATVVDHGKKPSNSDGMAFGLDGSLFFGGLTTDCVYRWLPGMGDASQAEILVNNAEKLWWVDTFAFDNRGNLLLTSNKLSFFFSGGMDFSGESGGNFRILSVPVGTVSYLAGDASGQPRNPMISLDLYDVYASGPGNHGPGELDASRPSRTMADVAGIVHWLHTEAVVESLQAPVNRENSDGSQAAALVNQWAVRQHFVKIRNPQAALEETRHSLLSDFGPFSVYGNGAPTPQYQASKSPGLDSMQARLGDFVGVQRQLDRRLPLPPDLLAFRFSLPGFCPNLRRPENSSYCEDCAGTPDAPNDQCLRYNPEVVDPRAAPYNVLRGGECSSEDVHPNDVDPDSRPGCSFSISYGHNVSTGAVPMFVDLAKIVGYNELACEDVSPTTGGGFHNCATIGGVAIGTPQEHIFSFRSDCTNSSYKRRFSLETGEIEETDYCVEYDIHPDCLLGCDLLNCTARRARGEEIELGIPFWQGRCSADANRIRVEKVFAAFHDFDILQNREVPIDHFNASKGLLVNDYVLGFLPQGSRRRTTAPCHRHESPKVCKPHGAAGGPYCFRGFSGVCQPCYVPGASDAFRHPACPLLALKMPQYTDPANGFSPLTCRSKLVKDLCCLYNSSDSAVRCEGNDDPKSAEFTDDGLMLVASRQNTDDMATFFHRVALEKLNMNITQVVDNHTGQLKFQAWAAEQWHAIPRHLSFDAVAQDLQDTCDCLTELPDLPKKPNNNTRTIVIIVVLIIIVLLVLALFCYLFRRNTTKTAEELAQSLQPTSGAQSVDARESSLQPRG